MKRSIVIPYKRALSKKMKRRNDSRFWDYYSLACLGNEEAIADLYREFDEFVFGEDEP